MECGILGNDSQIVCGSADGSAFIWDLVEEKVIDRLLIGKKNESFFAETVGIYLIKLQFFSAGSGVIQSLTTHPTTDDIIFANKRDFQLWGPPS